MKNQTKKALMLSVLSLMLCVSMLVGTTFAWFTDSVTTGVNTIQSGTLDIVLEYKDADGEWKDAEGLKLDFVKAQGAENEEILWEPGCTYKLPELRLRNNGNLALKYSFVVNGVDGDAKLLEAIEWSANGKSLTNFYGTLLPEEGKDVSETILISGHMLESAGNEYQNLTVKGIGITVFATQLTHESDSFDNQYDLAAPWTGFVPAALEDTTLEIVPGGGSQTGTITVNSAEDLVYLSKLAKEWVAIYSNGQGTNVGSYRENVGGKGTDYYYHWTWDINLAADLDMNNVPMDSVDISYWDTFNGNGHTIINVALKDGQDGLFNNGAKLISDLTVKNITVDAPGAQTVGAIAGNGSLVNVHVENATVVGGKYTGGLVGKGADFINCSVKNATVTGTDKTVGGLVGYSIGDPNPASVTGNVVENVTVTGTYNVGGLLGQSQNETVENNTVKNVTVNSTQKLPADASSNEVRAAELAARSAFANTTIGTNTIENVTLKDLIAVKTADDLVNAFANLSVGDTIYIANDIDMADKTIAPVTGNKSFTMLGNGYTIRNLKSTERALFVAHSGSSAYTFDGVVLENCAVDSTTNYGALFVGDGDTSDAITIKNCVVKNCTVKSAKYAAAFVAYTSGYNVVNNGPVYSDVLISNCEVIGGSITGGGSTAAAVGHAGGNDDTTTTIDNLKVDGVAINGEDAAHTGIAVGTAHVGDTVINNVTYSNVTGNYNTTTVLYGRFVPGTTGTLTIDGVSK